MLNGNLADEPAEGVRDDDDDGVHLSAADDRGQRVLVEQHAGQITGPRRKGKESRATQATTADQVVAGGAGAGEGVGVPHSGQRPAAGLPRRS